MILITGGAGFIGSNFHKALLHRDIETVVVDRLGVGGKWRNLASCPPTRLLLPEELDDFLEQRPPIEMVFHMGAISDTTTTDGDVAWATNVALSQRIWRWCATHDVRMVYASSAATYGDGSGGFDDDMGGLHQLRPLNLYGWTKHAFDLWVARTIREGANRPPQWVGLKFFNVYGPNEYHKGPMISVVKVKFDEIAEGRVPRLFRSDRADVADGEQRRDFIWVGDIVDVLIFLLDSPSVSGLFNLGTGTARTYAALAHAVCVASAVDPKVEFIEMPRRLRGQYQSFTEARMNRLRAAGYNRPFTSLEDGVTQYVKNYLSSADPYA